MFYGLAELGGNKMDATLDDIKLFKPAIPSREFDQLRQVFPQRHFARLQNEGFHFYRETFWYPLARKPENIFESVVTSLRKLAKPAAAVIGVEWWFSVLLTDATPQWLLPYHFDRNDLLEKDFHKLRHPEKSSVLFVNTVSNAELVVTDQILTDKGARPRQPSDMRFIAPRKNQYVVFPGHLYHGVIGRMWRPAKPGKLRISMAVNWWSEQPKASYMHDSRETMDVFHLRT